MKKRPNHSARASALEITFSVVLIATFAILPGLATPTEAKKPSGRDRLGFHPQGVNIPTLGNYPDTSIPLSTDTTVAPDAAPTNTTSINVSTSTNFNGRLEGNPVTGAVRVTDAHPIGTYTLTVRAFDSGGASVTKTFTLTVTTPVTCTPVNFTAAVDLSTGLSPVSAVVGDFNGDGRQDLAVANYDSTNVSILLGDGNGDFSTATNFGVSPYSPLSLAVGDFNGDGRQDLAMANNGFPFAGRASILLGNGAGGFSAASNFVAGDGPVGVAVGDFNGDGKQDLAVANQTSNNVSILLGNGAGSFGAATNFGAGTNPWRVAVGDFNGDGRQDLAVANRGSDNVSILLGDGAGHFSGLTSFPVGDGPYSVAVGDFNGDGKQDLTVANENSDNVSILLGDGGGNFSIATNFAVGSIPGDVVVGDFNGDGKQDLAVVNRGSDDVSILLGDGAGNFSAPTNFRISSTPHSVAVGDFNGDGKQDLAAANFLQRGVSILLRNCSLTPTPISAVSRKAHGGAGSFDINLPLTGIAAIECRRGGGASFDQHQVIVAFDGPVTSVGGVMFHALESGGSGSATATASGNNVTVDLTGVTDQHNYVITLTSVNGNASPDISIPIGILRGDTNGNAAVNAGDIGQTKAQSGQAVTAANFREDVDANGSISAADVSLVKSNSGAILPRRGVGAKTARHLISVGMVTTPNPLIPSRR
jgi:hypothetical protein